MLKKIFNEKMFLSEDFNEYGSICGNITKSDDYVDGTIRISDCNESISLTFYTSSKERGQRRLDKINKMIKFLQDYEKKYSKTIKNLPKSSSDDDD